MKPEKGIKNFIVLYMYKVYIIHTQFMIVHAVKLLHDISTGK